MRQISASGCGCTNRVASARTSLILWKAASASGVQTRRRSPLDDPVSKALRGCKMCAQPGMKR